jgi:hypothetical protein
LTGEGWGEGGGKQFGKKWKPFSLGEESVFLKRENRFSILWFTFSHTFIQKDLTH